MDREQLGRLVREAQIAFAAANPAVCPTCRGERETTPHCARCEDSTEDHVCPGAGPCPRCRGTGEYVPRAVRWKALYESERELCRQIGETVARSVIVAANDASIATVRWIKTRLADTDHIAQRYATAECHDKLDGCVLMERETLKHVLALLKGTFQ